MASPTPKKVSISTVKSRLLRPALTSHYVCKFSPTTVGGTKLLDFLREREGQGFTGADYQSPINQEVIELSCSEASLPGVNYMSNEIIDDFHGVTERYAYRRSYDDRMDFTFYVDRDYRPINFFESWIAFIAGEKQKPATADRNYFYRVEFPDNYTTDDLYITKFERDIGTPEEGPSLTYKFINAFPININTIPVSYDSSQLLKCTVAFSFSRYLIEKTTGTSSSPEPSGPTPVPGVPNTPPTISGPSPGIPDFSGSPLAPPGTAPGVPSTGLGGIGNLKFSNPEPTTQPSVNKNAGSGAVIDPPPATGSSSGTGNNSGGGSALELF